MRNPHNWLFKASILSICIDSTAGGAVSGVIPLMVKSFPDAPQMLIESITSLPSLATLLAIMLSPLVTKRIGYKNTVLLGLAISFFTGIAPAFIPNLYIILGLRFLFGIGIGLLNPLSYTIIAYFYQDDERSQMFGLNSSVASLSSLVLTAFVGFLLQFSWQISFFTYFILLGIFAFVFFVLPDVSVVSQANESNSKKTWKEIDHRVFYYAAVIFIYSAIWLVFNVKFGMLVIGKGYGNVSQATYVLSLTSIVGMFIGVLFGPLHKKLKNKLLPIAIVLMAATLVYLAVVNNLLLAAIGVILSASFYTIGATSIYLRVSEITTNEQTNAAQSIELIASNLGISTAPFLMGGLGSILGNSTPAFMFELAAIILFVLVTCIVGCQKIVNSN
jgi:MFS family permease